MTDFLQPLRNFVTTLKFITKGGKWYYAWLAVLGLLILWGVVSYIRQIDQGLILTNMRDQVSWGFYISNFTFLVGVAAAAVLLVIPAYLYNFKPIKEIVLLGEMLAITAIIMCLMFVVSDMGRPERGLIPFLPGMWWC
jgi:molybdopterin-containing oxidoreductase family membrane subunit